jgi:hypothetical protein
MDTKLKGDIAEQAAILQGLKRRWGVLKPIGDRLPYDLVFDVSGVMVKVQTKQAWYYELDRCYLLDNRRTKTNRHRMLRDRYTPQDFDFALAYLEELDLFYVFPVEVFIAYAGQITIGESDKRQRKPRSAIYRDAWDLISLWAASRETSMRTPVKVGEASCGGNPEPSSSPRAGEGVET